MIKVLYISGRRGKEAPLLSLLQSDGRVSYDHVVLHLKTMFGLPIVKALVKTCRLLFFKGYDVILLESPGLAALPLVPLKILSSTPMAVRIKGDFWQGYDEVSHDIPLGEKLAKVLNYYAGLLILRVSDLVIPVSEHIAETVRARMRPGKRIHVVHIPFSDGRQQHADASGSKLAGAYVLTVTNFNFWKKVEPLALAVRKNGDILKEKGFRWVVLGDGFFLEKFRSLIHEEIESGAAELPGKRDPYAYYKNAAAMFYVSGMDGLPNVLLESFYHRLPVAMDSRCPAAEFVTGGVNGIVTDFSDARAVEKLISELAGDRESLRRVSARAHEHVMDNFSASTVSLQLLDCLLDVVRGEAGRNKSAASLPAEENQGKTGHP